MSLGQHERRSRVYRVVAGVVALLLGGVAAASPPVKSVVPEAFLHLWDPITVFFAHPVGSGRGAVELEGERFLAISPPAGGSYLWLDERTLQFRPAEAWQAFASYTLEVGGQRRQLVVLPDPPLRTLPRDGETGVEEGRSVTLFFREPVAAEGLRDALRLRLRPSGEGGKERLLAGRGAELKVLERSARSDPAGYTFTWPAPLPPATTVVVELLARPQPEAEPKVWHSFRFTTAAGFFITAVTCGREVVSLPAEGVSGRPDHPVACDVSSPLRVLFSQPLGALDLAQVRALVRLSPPVEGFGFRVEENQLVVEGRFVPDHTYRLDLHPAPLRDHQGRRLALGRPATLYLQVPPLSPFVELARGAGVVERHGPKLIPLTGRGSEQVEVSVLPLDPLDLAAWPFPPRPLTVGEGRKPRPPESGRTVPAGSGETVRSWQLEELLLSPPPRSLRRILDLPLAGRPLGARFGLDLAPLLAELTGSASPAGAFLVGVRPTMRAERQWMRLQVTDLALTTVEQRLEVGFFVTSLRSGAPVAGAAVTVEGLACDQWRTFFAGTTDSEGRLLLPVRPVEVAGCEPRVRRLSVRKDDDVLVWGAEEVRDLYFAGRLRDGREPWLQWLTSARPQPPPPARELSHIFSERPVYRPEEGVHLKGYVRAWREGRLELLSGAGAVVVHAPTGQTFRYPVRLTSAGSFYHLFKEENLPTGEYTAAWENARGEELATARFRLEAYRVPEFEVNLAVPEVVPSDREFTAQVTATYYAGGRVVARPVRVRVTQFPYLWQPPAWQGFFFSSDARFGGAPPFRARPALEQELTTDEDGGARVVLNPALEPSAQPRTYVVEVTVVGVDEQTVTATRQVHAVPPFVVGVKAARFVAGGGPVRAQVVAVGPDGKGLAGQELTFRVKRRSWHSVLQLSDFTTEAPRYVTEVVDEVVSERSLISQVSPTEVTLAVREAGVYLVEVEGRDRLGRTQVVSVDFFLAGGEAVSWPRSEAGSFGLAWEKASYAPGETARLVLESPYQQAWGLVVLEAPTGNRYRWVRVEGGKGVAELSVEGPFAPGVPVHVVLMRGRLAGVGPQPGTAVDVGKPATVAASTTLKVMPLDKQVKVELNHPSRALPGEKVAITVRLADPAGRPLAGEVALWLVDAAVLALGREQRLDPLPDFLLPHEPRSVIQDTRNRLFGLLPLEDLPGGEQAAEEALLFERNTVRKRFESVPYYNPAIAVDPDGSATVEVSLPDNLTVFAVRAKAVSGPERFGFATGRLEVRLPVIVQPALPRFLRHGDRLELAVVARVVEGSGGAAEVELEAPALGVAARGKQPLQLSLTQPARFTAQGEVPALRLREEGREAFTAVTVRAAVRRLADGARDAFEVALPVHLPAQEALQRQLLTLAGGTPLKLPALPAGAAPGSTRRVLLLAPQEEVIRLAAGLNFLHSYPYGCTEQRLAASRAFVAHGALLQALGMAEQRELAQVVRNTVVWLGRATDGEGLVAFWPGDRGSVVLTAWALLFLEEAKTAGFPVEAKLGERYLGVLESSLRSDFRRLLPGAEMWERSWALLALARAGRFNPGYAAELARRVEFLDLETTAQVLLALRRGGQGETRAAQELTQRLWGAVQVRSHQGRDVYAGLAGVASPREPRIFPTEARTLAAVVSALAAGGRNHPKWPSLLGALLNLGAGDGWGNTNANAAGCLALAEVLVGPQRGEPARRVTLASRTSREALRWEPGQAPLRRVLLHPDEAVLTLEEGPPLAVYLETRYLPAKLEPAGTAGLAVGRQWWRVGEKEAPLERTPLEATAPVELSVGEVVEEHVELVNPEDRFYVAVSVPLAAGMEPLNPNLATAPPEATPSRAPTRMPDWTDMRDDAVVFFFNELPAGTYHLFFRTRAQVAGEFTQPAALAELMYQQAVRGWSSAAKVRIRPK